MNMSEVVVLRREIWVAEVGAKGGVKHGNH